MLFQSSRVSSVVSKSDNKRIRRHRGMLKWAVMRREGWGRQSGGAEVFLHAKQV